MSGFKDGLQLLAEELYGEGPAPKDYLGGSDAKILHDAVDRIQSCRRLRNLYLEILVEHFGRSAVLSMVREKLGI